jgi:lambda family phage tail tape measure protein
MAVIGSLSVKLGLVTVDWDKSTAQAKQQAKQLQNTLNTLTAEVRTLGAALKNVGGILGVGGFALGAMIQQTMAFSGQVKDLSDSMGISIAKTLQFRDAIQGAGGNAEGATKMLSTLFTKIAEAQNGNDKTIATFEQLGITFKELQTLNPEQLLNKIVKGLAGITNQYEKIKQVKELLGKQGIQVDITQVAEKLGMSVEKYRQYEQSIIKVGNAADALQATFDNLKIAFADMISPFAGEGIVSIEAFKAVLVGMTSYAVIGGLFKIAEAFLAIRKALKELAEAQIVLNAAGGLKGLVSLLAGGAAYLYFKNKIESDMAAMQAGETGAPSGGSGSGTTPEWEKIRKSIDMQKQLMALDKEYFQYRKENLMSMGEYESKQYEIEYKKKQDLIKLQGEYNQKLADDEMSGEKRKLLLEEFAVKSREIAEKAKQDADMLWQLRQKENMIIDESIRMDTDKAGIEKELLNLEARRYMLSDFEYQKQAETLQFEKKILELRNQLVEASYKLGSGWEFDKEKQRIDNLIKVETELHAVRQRTIEQNEEIRTSFVEGWESATRKFKQDSTNAFRLGEQAFTSMTDSMTGAINNFVESGKFSFSDLISSMIKDLLRFQLQAQATSLFNNIGGFFKALIPSGGFSSGNASPGIKLSGFADGGEPPVGVPSIVGERGAELFVPKTSGTIIPNHQLSSALGASQQVIYNGTVIQNMSAIDTQSGVQFIAKNKDAIWAANQSANRSLPMSR